MPNARYRLSRRASLGLAGAAAAGSVLVRLPGRSASAQVLDKVSYQTNWRVQAEHGGFYQAVVAGIYRKYGIDGDLRMGGPQISNSQLRLGGRIDIIMSSGLEALNYAKEDLPFLCIAAIFQKDPQVLIGHKGSGNDSFDNDNTTLAASRKLVTEKKDLVQRFVTATLEGWGEYLEGGPGIEAANAQIKKDNPDMTDDKIAYAIKVMNENGIVHSGDALTLEIGAMTDARWQRFYKSMAELGVLPAGVDPAKGYSLDFVNKGVGKA